MGNHFIDLSKKTILVTGSTAGIGLDLCKSLDKKNTRLILVGRDENTLNSILSQLENQEHEKLICDLSSEEQVQRALEKIEKSAYLLDGAVLAAGAHLVRPFQLTKVQHFREMLASNLETAVHGLRLFLKKVNPQGSSVVLFSSAAAIRGSAGVSAYSAAKGAILALSKSLAVELAPKKIRVNVLVPGVVMTRMTEKFFSSLSTDQRQQIQKSHLLGLGETESIVPAIEFLLSQQSKWVTGTEFIVDGGLTCKS